MNESGLKHGAFGWNELMTTDVAAARQFYCMLQDPQGAALCAIQYR